ncbi:putative quinol monooxygenase [Roseivirga pacifica]
MLIRIVRMTFKPEEVDNFLALFEATKEKIRGFEGCCLLELWKDYNEPNIFTTYSHWENEDALNKYRHSELFKAVWANTKSKFADKPVAFSSKKEMEVG